MINAQSVLMVPKQWFGTNIVWVRREEGDVKLSCGVLNGFRDITQD